MTPVTTPLWADAGRRYEATAVHASHDGIDMLLGLRDELGTSHVALCTGETATSLAYLVAEVDEGLAADAWRRAPELREAILTSPRVVRVEFLFFGAGGSGDGCAPQVVESSVEPTDLTDDELPSKPGGW